MKRLVFLCALAPAMGCESVTELPLKVVLPEDTSDLDQADNLTLTLTPTGEYLSQATNGTDFSIELAIETNTLVQATLYLAQGSELLAWGRTPYFLDASPAGLALFLGRPGRLSTLPRTLDAPDASALAAYLPARGVASLGSDGSMRLLSEYSLEFSAGPELPVGVQPSHAGLFTLSDGLLYAGWGEGAAAYRFDLDATAWVELSGDAPDANQVEADAPRAANYDDSSSTHQELVVYGVDQLWSLELDALDSGSDSLTWSSFGGSSPDGARPGASALLLPLEDGATEFLVFGSDDDRGALWSSTMGAFGPAGPWTGGSCVPVDPDEKPIRVLCAGGERNGAPVSDLLVLEQDLASGDWSVEERPDALPAALSDPLWYSDETALYAQGDGQLLRIARDSLEPDNTVSSAQRFAEGHSVQLPTGATFQVGGTGQEGQPLTRWQVFMPALQP